MTSQHGSEHLTGRHETTSPEPPDWTGTDQSMSSSSGQFGSASPQEGKNFGNMNFLSNFSNPLQQKKVTRDGQPAKRRGPKPDSKPAQTRRQELNRQAQRTHRERKEQYIKALEIELARLREVFVNERATVENHLRVSDMRLREQQQENMVLREILNSRGIGFDQQLQQQKNVMNMGSTPQTQVTRGISPNYPLPQSSPFTSSFNASQSQSGMSEIHHPAYPNGAGSAMTGHSPSSQNNPSPGGTHHSNSPPEIQETGRGKDSGIPDMPGIFEKDPQLGIDFILALEHTCRDHGEYLVRRSLASPDTPTAAHFSGHALMATIPPPSHISSTPASHNGVDPTYPHQAPQASSMQALNTLLNLSQVIKSEGYVEGGQVTPIMALQSLRGHYNYTSLTRDDVVGMIEAIRNKVRCYGFGAVMEDFELRDALAAMFAMKPEAYEGFNLGGGFDGEDRSGRDLMGEIDEMYS